MKIYKSDGSFVDIPDDREFGWKFEQTIINNEIEEYVAKTTIKTTLEPEGVRTEGNDKNYKNIDGEIPQKQQVANLIQPYSVENKILLAVVHYAKYKQLIKGKCAVNLDNLRHHSSMKFLIDRIKNDHDLDEEISKYDGTKENNNVLSLMTEIILTDLKCDLDDLKNISTNDNSGDKGQDSSKMTNSIDNKIYNNIERICKETYDMRLTIDEIKKSFQEDQIRVEALIKQAQNLEKSLREKKFLDELLHFLNGDLDKIAPKQCPFKILLGPITNFDDINLII